MSELAIKLIQKAKEEKATFIDLGNCGLTEIPQEILELADTIEHINLGDFYCFEGVIGFEIEFKQSKNNLRLNNFENRTSSFNFLTKLKQLKKLELQTTNIEFNNLSKITQLTHLSINSNSFKKNNIKEFCKLTSLTHLEISGCELGDEGAKELGTLISLTHLFIWSNNIGDEGVKGLSKLTSLAYLEISDNNIGAKGAKELAKLNYLIHLKISNNILGPEGAKELGKSKSILHLDIAGNKIGAEGAKGLGKSASIKYLEIGSNDIGAEGVKGLSKLTSLTYLSIGNNNIGNEGAKELGSFKIITDLFIWNNNIGDEGVKGLYTLTTLSNLDVSENNIGADGAKWLGKMKSLSYLSIDSNNIDDEGAKGLSKSKSLIRLFISNNNIGDDGAKELSKLTSLTQLFISGNKIGDEGAKGLSKSKSLARLNLSYNNIGDDGAIGLGMSKSLTHLYISDNKIGDEGAKGLGTSSLLVYLDISSNQISTEGAIGLSKLTKLTKLYIDGNYIGNQGAKEISKLKTLVDLSINKNNIGDDGAKELSKLPSLVNLFIGNNHIGTVGVKKLANLTTLIHLSINKNNILSTKVFKHFKNLEELNLEGNLIKDAPESIINQYNCLNDLKIWWEETVDETKVKPNKMVKLQVLGNGNAGKSSTIEALKYGICKKEFISTHGIIIEPLNYMQGDEEVVFQAWDFGGQEIYHGTHKLFIASQSIQLLIADEESELLAHKLEKVPDRQNTNELVLHQPLRHYIDMCKRQSPRSIRLIAKNKSEIKSMHKDIETIAFKNNLPCFSISATKGDGINDLKNLLAEKRKDILGFAMLMPVSWLEVQQYFLDNLKRKEVFRQRLIDFEMFNEICKIYHVSDISIKPLLEFLHHTGIVYKNENLLKDTIIIDQKWALEAIYKPLDRSSSFYDELRNDFKGRVRVKNLFKAFGEGYVIEHKWLFLHFMQSCGLCFPLNERNKEQTEESYFIFPEFLPETETPAAYEIWKLTNYVKEFTYTPEYLDYFFIQQFIVAIGNKTKVEYIWKTGIVVVTENGKFRVEVINNKVIKISIEKEIIDKYLPLIIDIFEDAEYRNNVTDWKDEKGEILDLDFIKNKESKFNSDGFESEFSKNNSKLHEEKDLKTVLPNVEQPRPIRVVISYASEDLQALEDLRETLAPFDGKIQILYDKKIINGSRTFSSQIVEMFEDADCYIILVSKKYQNKEKKDYIWVNEFPIIKKRQEQKGIHVYCLPVAPVLLNAELAPLVCFRKGTDPLPEKGHDRENYLIAFAKEIVENNILKINETK